MPISGVAQNGHPGLSWEGCDIYPWDGVSGVRPFSRLATITMVGVY